MKRPASALWKSLFPIISPVNKNRIVKANPRSSPKRIAFFVVRRIRFSLARPLASEIAGRSSTDREFVSTHGNRMMESVIPLKIP